MTRTRSTREDAKDRIQFRINPLLDRRESGLRGLYGSLCLKRRLPRATGGSVCRRRQSVAGLHQAVPKLSQPITRRDTDCTMLVSRERWRWLTADVLVCERLIHFA